MKTWHTFILALAAGGVAGMALGRWLKQSGPALSREDALWVLAALPFAGFFVILWHEAGHLIGGRLRGFRPRLLGVGPLLIRWRDGGATLGFNRHWELWGGIASALPPKDSAITLSEIQSALASFTAAGPLASLVLALFGVAAGFALPSTLAWIAWATAAISALITAGTLQPWGAGAGLVSDGGRLLMLRQGGPQAERWSALAVLFGLNLDRVRPRDWPPELVARASAAGGPPTDHATALLLRFEHAWDLGDEPAAQAALDELLAMRGQLNRMLTDAVNKTEAMWNAAHQRDHDALEALLRDLAQNQLATSSGSYDFYRELTHR